MVLKVVDPRRCGPKAVARLRREFEVGRSLDLPAVVKPLALEAREDMPVLVLEDFGGQPLDRLCGGPLATERFLDVGVHIAGALAELHGRGIVHRDINPENILVHPVTLEVKLADLGLATRLPREVQAPRPPELIEGSLPYLSPEQTGRMNAAVDSRTDLYSLGVTFYQMLTGRLPFEARDPLEWVHCHIARAPVPPARVLPEIPEVISGIVMRLLAKTPDDRYQSARGLRHDLERCVEAWRSSRRIDPFPLGERDAPDRLQMPQRLYGREAEIAVLVGAFERVAEMGSSELVVVSGHAGIGKSSLAHALHEPVVRRHGLFVASKCEPHEHEVPHGAMRKAFRELILGVLVETEERIAGWRERLVAALGMNARVVADVLPALELVIGPQPPVPELPPSEARHRLRAAFRRFVGVFARKEHPLALFLDDLQWADPASLALLQDLVASPDTPFLLVVGAYRDDEVAPAHPLVLTLDAARKAGAPVSDVVVGPLSGPELTAFVADALRCDPHEAAPLAALVREKTAANPFFARQFLAALHGERLLELDERTGRWRWDLERIRTRSFTENVVELMTAALRRLPPETQDALKELACLGSSADVGTAAMVVGRPEEDVDTVLWRALREGLVLRVDGAVRFLHDRVREAAYALIPEASRPAAHLRIGLLLSGLSAKEVEERVFEIVSQLNRGIDLLGDPRERDALRRLDLLAGRKARAATAYGAALGFVQRAAGLLAPDAWTARYHDAFAIHLELAECEVLAGEFRRADESLDALLGKAASELDRARVHLLRMRLYQGSGRFDDALRTGLAALRRFGVSFPEGEAAVAAALEAETSQIRMHLRGRHAADLADAPELVDPDVRTVMQLLIESFVPAYNARPEVHPLLLARILNLTLQHGTTEESSLACYAYAMLLVSRFGDMGSALEFSETSLRLAERYDDPRARAAAVGGCGSLRHWWGPIASGLPFLERGFRAQQETGELARAAIIAVIAAWTVVAENGDPLDEVLAASERYLAFAEESRNDVARDTIRLIRQLVPAMKGATRGPGSLEDDQFSEAACLGAFERAHFGAGIGIHRVLKQMVAFVYGRYDEALEAALQRAAAPGPASAFLYDATHHLFRALSAAALHSGAPAARQQELARIVDEELKRHALWAESCPESFLHRHALVSAEAARIAGREVEAERGYEQAIRSARENGFVQHEAIAYELASRFYRARGFERFADAYLGEARACYLRWGADGKVRQLDDLRSRAAEWRPPAPRSSLAEPSEQLDLLSVAKGAQTISGEIRLERLVATLLEVVLEQGGAQRGVLMLARDGQLFIEAEAVMGDGGATTRLVPALSPTSPLLVPSSLVQYARRTREPVILSDAARDLGRFSSDPYFDHRRPRSLLCLPILRQAELRGLLYLENDLVPGAFTPDRLMALTVLASQAAISVENASLLAKAQGDRAAAEEARSRAAFLADAGTLLAESLDIDKTLTGLARLCVRSMANWCLIDLLDGRKIRRVGGAHSDPAKEPLLREVERRYPPHRGSRNPSAQVLRTGQALLRAEVSDEDVRASCEDDEHARLVLELGLRWDRSRLEQVVTNLLTNAVKFAPGTPIEISIAAASGTATLMVRDRGIGISSDAQRLVFRRFGRAVSPAEYGGLGLGLFISRRIVEAHEGSIRVESRPGEGSTFTVELPLTKL